MRAAALVAVVAATVLTGCPQPPAPSQTPPGTAGAPPAAGPPGGKTAGGAPAGDARAPSTPGGPPNGPGCTWAGMEGAWSKYKDKDQVQVSGELAFSGNADGGVIVDFLDDSKDIALSVRCTKAGPFEIKVPAGLGKLHVVAFVDADFNGPSANDVRGRTAAPIDVATAPITGVSIAMSADADMGDLKLPDPAKLKSFKPPEGKPTGGPVKPTTAPPGGDEPPPDDDGGGNPKNPYK